MFVYFTAAAVLFCYLNDLQWVVDEIIGFGLFFALGLGGAIVANATGAGGGVVFIPAFSSLGLYPSQVLATSILIQCFGMSAGAISWFISFKNRAVIFQRYQQFMVKAVITATLSSVTGALLSQWFFHFGARLPMLTLFSLLSIFFGLTLLVSIFYSESKSFFPKAVMSKGDYILLIPICFVGGVITSTISVGVGECLLVLLFLRRFPMQVSIFVAVCVSAINVIVCAPYQVFIAQSVAWDVVFFAAPAALVGGILGRFFALKLGASRVKVFCAVWILATGIAM
ncbi:MAG: sulfite exporter TauE/SafE family protein [Mariprofundus sp.]|nr:sulfite exporter TauE/SafE family protein [Mariprofundus sp.]